MSYFGEHGFKSRLPDISINSQTAFYAVTFLVAAVKAALPRFADMPKDLKYRKPVLKDYNGDLGPRWYILYYAWSVKNQKLIRKRFYGDLNHYPDARKRYELATYYLAEISRKLAAGAVADEKEEAQETPSTFQKFTIAQAISHYIQQHPRLSHSWLQYYSRLSKGTKIYFDKETPISKIQPLHIQGFMSYFQASKKFGPKSYNHYLGLLRTIFTYFKDLEIIKTNPARRPKKLKVPKGEKHYPYTIEQVKAIGEEALAQNEKQFYFFTKMLFYTAARINELRQLRVSDIGEKTIFIKKEDAKSSRSRHTTIAPALEKYIQENQIRTFPLKYYVFGQNGKPSATLIGVNRFYKINSEILTRLNFKDQPYTLYSFKHTSVIQMYLNGIDLITIRDMCGHQDVKTTEIYLRDLGVIRSGENQLGKMPEI